MSDDSKIEWTDATWNPVRGCSAVSEGCRNCYAMRVAHRFSGACMPYEGLTRATSDGPKWTGDVRLLPELLDAPLRWKKPRRVFVNSMSDLFHPDVPEEFIAAVWFAMNQAPQHIYQILTKRPERMAAILTADYRRNSDEPFPNVWLGVSCEDQATADERIPHLLNTPAAVRWISAEPLLGPTDLRWINLGDGRFLDALDGQYIDNDGDVIPVGPSAHLNWIVTGGESGPGSRPMHPQWARSLRDQCTEAAVPFFYKQTGDWVPCQGYQIGDVCLSENGFSDTWTNEFPCYANESDGTTLRRVGKKAAGRLLDGREWNEYPETHK